MNCFGLDRAGAQIYFAVPHKLSTALVAKNLACGMYLYLEVLLLSAITATLGMVAGWAVSSRKRDCGWGWRRRT